MSISDDFYLNFMINYLSDLKQLHLHVILPFTSQIFSIQFIDSIICIPIIFKFLQKQGQIPKHAIIHSHLNRLYQINKLYLSIIFSLKTHSWLILFYSSSSKVTEQLNLILANEVSLTTKPYPFFNITSRSRPYPLKNLSTSLSLAWWDNLPM